MTTALQTRELADAGGLVPKKKTTPKRASSESRRHGVLVRLGEDVVEIAKEVAAMRKMSMAEYLTDRLKPIVNADRDVEVMKRMPKK